MPTRRTLPTRRTVLAAVTAGTLLTGGAVALAAPGSTPAPAPPAASSSPASGAPSAPARGSAARPADPSAERRADRRAVRAQRAGRLLHGERVVQREDGSTHTLGAQRGAVTAVSATSVTLRSSDGFTRSYTLTPTSRVRVAGAKATVTDVHTGDAAAAAAELVGGTWQLRLLADPRR